MTVPLVGFLLLAALLAAYSGWIRWSERAARTALVLPTRAAPTLTATPPRAPSPGSTTGRMTPVARVRPTQRTTGSAPPVAAGGLQSHGTTQRVRVQSAIAWIENVGVELRHAWEDVHHVARVPWPDGWYVRQRLPELLARLRTEIDQAAPEGGPRDLVLTHLQAEGPVDAQGRSPLGWSFTFVQPTTGVECRAIVTPQDALVVWSGQATCTLPQGADAPLPDPAALVARADEAIAGRAAPAVEGWMMRIQLPAQARLWKPASADPAGGEAGVLLDEDPLHQRLANRDLAHRRGPLHWPPAGVAWTATELLERCAAEDLPPTPAHPDAPSPAGLRNHLADDLRRAARALLRAHGPAAPLRLLDALGQHPDQQLRLVAVQVLHAMPGGLATVAMHRALAGFTDALCRQAAEGRFHARCREGARADDLLRPMDWLQLRQAGGWPQPDRYALPSRADVLTPLRDILETFRLRPVSIHALSGLPEVTLAVHFRGDTPGAEALLASIPLPVPCHILYLDGLRRDLVWERLRLAGLLVTPAEIQRDADSIHPATVHRAALYLAALNLRCLAGSRPLLAAMERGINDPHLRRAVLAALHETRDDLARETLQRWARDEDHPERARIQTLLASWA